MKTQVSKLCKQIGYEFTDGDLLTRALTHRSAQGKNNERLEFLGDSILNFIVAEELFARHPDKQEGELSRMRANLVNSEKLMVLARQFNLSDYIQLGAGELKSGGFTRASILSDAVEAIIGAIYLDSDFQTCRKIVIDWYTQHVTKFDQVEVAKDAKTMLQEFLQARKLPLPNYSVIKITGKAHAQTFHVECFVEGLPDRAEAQAQNRRKAEQLAAKLLLDTLEANAK